MKIKEFKLNLKDLKNKKLIKLKFFNTIFILFILTNINKRNENRTHTDDFEDHCSTTKLFPFIIFNYVKKTNLIVGRK